MFNFSRPSGPALPAADIVARAKAGKMVVIDVRDPGEIQMTGKAEGALEIPMAIAQMKVDPRSPECLAELELDTAVALYCVSGTRSGMIMQLMQNLGYQEVYNLGNLEAWVQGGGEIVT